MATPRRDAGPSSVQPEVIQTEEGNIFLSKVFNGEETEPFTIHLIREGVVECEFVLDPQQEQPTDTWIHQTGEYRVGKFFVQSRLLEYDNFEVET